jgi:hypothetical protein
MSATHDYTTTTVVVSDLDSTHVLVGESGGLSAIYDTSPSNVMMGCQAVETEHGTLYLDADETVVVLA